MLAEVSAKKYTVVQAPLLNEGRHDVTLPSMSGVLSGVPTCTEALRQKYTLCALCGSIWAIPTGGGRIDTAVST